MILKMHACAGTSAALMAFAPNLEVLLLGRTIYGLGIGFTMHAAPAYIAEAAPAEVRGLLIRQVNNCFPAPARHSLCPACIFESPG